METVHLGLQETLRSVDKGKVGKPIKTNMTTANTCSLLGLRVFICLFVYVLQSSNSISQVIKCSQT